MHDEHDITVFSEHSKARARALERRRVSHEPVLMKDGDHGLLEPCMRLTPYPKPEAFLAADLGSPRVVRLSHKIMSGETLT